MAQQVGPATAGGGATASGASDVVGTDVGAGNSAAVADSAAAREVIPFVSQVPGTPVSFPSFHGRPVSWVAVSLIMFAFLIGGLALVFRIWWLFWVSLGVAAIGGLMALGTGILDDWY